tara:strand:- start:780 stop:2201 length:1422 start_codon:yes stop_codon:yes gene_type:complete
MKGKKQPNSILGLTFEGRRLESSLVKKARGGYRVSASASNELTLDPLVDDPELVGREIKDRLHEAGVSEKRVAVGLPLEWMLSSLVKLPDLPDEHIDGFIRLQAERSFPFSIDDLCVDVSKVGAGEDRHALITAVPRKHVDLMESALVHAGLKPISFSLGQLAQQNTQDTRGHANMSLFVNNDSVSVLITSADRPVCVRSFKDAWTGEEPVRQLDTKAIGRELRITLGQIPVGVRRDLKSIDLIGAPGLTNKLADEIRPRAKALGLEISTVEAFQPNGAPVSLPFSGSVSPALAIAARYLDQKASPLEYLPPKISQWQKLAEKVASRRAGILAGTGIAAVVITAAAFLWQSHKLADLETRWDKMRDKVYELEDVQSNIRKFRSWYDVSQPTLKVLRDLSLAFPENDSITAKTMEIKGRSKIAISGTARNPRAVTALAEALAAMESFTEVKIETMRGEPVQWSIVFVHRIGGAR